MTTPEGRRTIVFNGEIYNFRELASKLEGTQLRTKSDTEVLLHFAGTHDLGWLDELNGMFAFAFWDEDTQTLLLARDRLGIKPLYYCACGDDLLFASEIKALFADPRVERRLNETVVGEYLAYRNVAGPETMFAGIREVPPGHALLVPVHGGRTRLERWWSDIDPDPGCPVVPPPAPGHLQECLCDAIRYRLIANVPVGTYNSGGVDSSLVSFFVRQQASDELHTFSVGFSEAPYDEREFARQVSEVIGSTHHSFVMDADLFARNLESAIWWHDEPLHHAHTVPLVLLSREAKRLVSVVLTGEGADELFAGYPRYQIPQLAAALGRCPAWLCKGLYALSRAASKRRLAKLLASVLDHENSTITQARFVDDGTVAALCGPSVDTAGDRPRILKELKAKPGLETVLAYDRATYMQSLLQRLDRSTMANGLEARVPFLDHHLLAWSRRLRSRQKQLPGRDNKLILKRLARAYFRSAIIDRRKLGFDVPFADWIRERGLLREHCDLLTDATFASRGYCSPRTAARLVDSHLKMEADHADILWPLINLELWLRMFIDDRPPAFRGRSCIAAGTSPSSF